MKFTAWKIRGVTCLLSVQGLRPLRGCVWQLSLSDVPETVALFLYLRPFEGSSLGRGLLLSVERSLAESAQGPFDVSLVVL